LHFLLLLMSQSVQAGQQRLFIGEWVWLALRHGSERAAQDSRLVGVDQQPQDKRFNSMHVSSNRDQIPTSVGGTLRPY